MALEFRITGVVVEEGTGRPLTGLSSPAIVNDVVFIATTKSRLYALCAATGLCLWASPSLGAGTFYMMGPATYGRYVVAGSANGRLYIYSH